MSTIRISMVVFVVGLALSACSDERGPAPPAPATATDAPLDTRPLADGIVAGATGLAAHASSDRTAAQGRRDLGVDTRAVRALVEHGGQLVAATRGGLLVIGDDGRVERAPSGRFAATSPCLGEDACGSATNQPPPQTGGDVAAGDRGGARGLASHDLRTAYVDAADRLWLAARTGGCQWLDTALRVHDCPASLADERITAFAEHDGALHAVTWRGTRIVLAVAADGATTVVRRDAQAAPGQSHALVSCGAHLVAGSQREGVAIVDPTRGARLRIGGTRLVDALTCHDGALWVAGPRGVARLDGLDGTWTHLEPGGHRRHATALLSTPRALFVAVDGGQVLRVDAPHAAPTLVPVGRVPATARAAVAVDGALWFGGDDVLASVREDSDAVVQVALHGPGDVDVSDLEATADGGLVAGTFRRGVGIFDPARGAWRRVTTQTGLPSDEVNAVEVSEAAAWVGTSRGLARVQLPGGHVTDVLGPAQGMPCLHVNDLHDVGDGRRLLVATSCGVGVVDLERREVTRFDGPDEGLPHRIVYALATRSRGDAIEVVAGTNDGLATRELDAIGQRRVVGGRPEQHGWTRHRAGGSSTALEDNWITAVAVGGDGRLFVGTYSGGLYAGDEPGALGRIHGPRYVNLNAVTVDARGTVWVGGLDEGAWHLAPDAERARAVDAACLPGNDVTAFAITPEGTLQVATRSGIWPLDCSG